MLREFVRHLAVDVGRELSGLAVGVNPTEIESAVARAVQLRVTAAVREQKDRS
jgi:hypothetical protein